MKIENVEDLERVMKLCTENNINSIQIGDITLVFHLPLPKPLQLDNLFAELEEPKHE